MSRLSHVLRAPIRLPSFGRGTAHVAFGALIWPIITVAGASIALTRLPYYPFSVRDALLSALVGTALRLPEMLLAGAAFFGLSWCIFRRLGAADHRGRAGAARLAVEPLLMLLAVIAGVSLWYPAVLSQPLLSPLAPVPAAVAVLLIGGVVLLGAAVTGRSGKRLRLAAALIGAGVLSPGPLWARAALEPFIGSPSTLVLLGLDSMSHGDDLTPFSGWVKRVGGTWYERAVAPGLLTNAVWTSILTMQPVREHGVFHTFQRFPVETAALIAAARAQGYRTVSVFPDQLTCTVGSSAGFDEDRSGPAGWRQLLLPAIANSSFLLPILTPALPRRWHGASLPNEAGTFTYDVRREIRSILRGGAPGQRTLVAAHLTYTHLGAYPRSAELAWAEIWRLARAPAGTIRDRSFDWQDEDLPTDPLPLHRWKLEHLQRVIEAEVEASEYLEGGGRLVVFSDHGDRVGLTLETFTEERYHHVLLATFGLGARCPQAPISLIDIGSLIGLSGGGAAPSVEFTIPPEAMWPSLVRTARLRWSGDVDLDVGALAGVFTGLRRHDPWPLVKSVPSLTDNECRPLAP
jgi:hypothetical protein